MTWSNISRESGASQARLPSPPREKAELGGESEDQIGKFINNEVVFLCFLYMWPLHCPNRCSSQRLQKFPFIFSFFSFEQSGDRVCKENLRVYFFELGLLCAFSFSFFSLFFLFFFFFSFMVLVFFSIF